MPPSPCGRGAGGEGLIAENRIIELKAYVATLDHPEEALVDLMHEAQDAYGYLSDEAVLLVADIAGVSPLKVDQIATFYNLIFRRPVGRKVILVCENISCWVMGMDNVFEHLKKKLGIDVGETTADGAFTLLPICCLGACHEAPAMMIADRLYGNLTPERIDEILEKERNS
jgi:NADH-quinone oxidoreductase subunit E